MNNLRNLNNVSKILFILLVGIIFYFVIFLIFSSIFIKKPASMIDMMSLVIGSNNSATAITIINFVSSIIAIAMALIASFYLFKHENKEKEYNILRKALSENEKKILDEIKKAGEITQDSLRFRLNWSKAKISTILTNLDKMNLIQRERTGKTYKVYLQKSEK